ncbi:hypothetical protein ACJ73_07556 [Blastomyces percursus]|uniref:Aminoglycoside phosphotransferase domain-containing protein n=1 Tax=Blastomyces percursus TaxID=1658174 RepID=A0A1J9R0L4_9EURO|nr:hypothetical protein ACJ73_07556 [Blastomyces percursus]
MLDSFIPAILRPDFTWPRPVPSAISEATPPLPHISSRNVRVAWGVVHRSLYYFSQRYCSWFGITFNAHFVQLPFGLVMKWTDRTSIEEVVSMQMAGAAGIPVPRVLNCGEHPKDPFKISILMTRLPGVPLENSAEELQVDLEEPWLEELSKSFHLLPDRNALRSTRVPRHIMGPFTDHTQLLEYLISPASPHALTTMLEYEDTLARVQTLKQRDYRITFTHGDFKAHNILIGDDGHLSGFLDWESAGWYPEYWEYTTAMRFGKGSWWFQVASWMGGDRYSDELASDVALNLLTVDSYIAF